MPEWLLIIVLFVAYVIVMRRLLPRAGSAGMNKGTVPCS
jgi:hypothetical protein